jgi:hypothetical protein
MAQFVVVLGNGYYDLYRIAGTFNTEAEAQTYADNQNSDSVVIELVEVQ